MKRSFAFYFLLLTSCFSLPAQVWYFGNGAGIKFSSSGIQALHGGKIYTNEGCSAVYDEKGNLLLYSDGIAVWNKNNSVLKNGEGLNGNRSATQSALIIPKPGSKKLFYVFTADTSAGEKGICYSVADISENSIISKNQKLFSPATEKLTAISHSNGKDIWLIAHTWNSNNFLSYPVTEKGVGAPVISSAGILHKESGAGHNREAIGEMKFSYDGKKIAVAICYRSANNLEVLDFDNSTGKISKPVPLSANGFPYGVCFSPDNSKLYVSFLKGTYGIVQYDLSSMNSFPVTLNEVPNSFGSLQLGPDGKICVARNGCCLDIIDIPNNKGAACNYREAAIKLLPSSSSAFGLPNLFQPNSASQSTDPSIHYSALPADCSKIIEAPFSTKDAFRTAEISTCENEYMLNAKNAGVSFLWSTAETTQKIRTDTSGLYRVTIQKAGCILTDSVKVRFKKDLSVFRYLPDFNPESDFLNSEFYYSIEEVSDFDLKVFDQKNKILFETKNPEQKWNGKNGKKELVAAGEYKWEVKFTPQCPKYAKQVIQPGKVTVKRSKK